MRKLVLTFAFCIIAISSLMAFDLVVPSSGEEVYSLFNSDNRPDAVYALSDVFALAAIKAAETVGLNVPDDVIVSGFDDIDFTGYTTPSITTVRQPSYQLGYLSAEILIDKIEKKNTSVQHIILDTELIVRESTFVKKQKEEI